MSENEDFYDKEIAPVLLDLSRKCAERGMQACVLGPETWKSPR